MKDKFKQLHLNRINQLFQLPYIIFVGEYEKKNVLLWRIASHDISPKGWLMIQLTYFQFFFLLLLYFADIDLTVSW